MKSALPVPCSLWDNYFGYLGQRHPTHMRNRLNRLHKIGDIDVRAVSNGMAGDIGLEPATLNLGMSPICRPLPERFDGRTHFNFMAQSANPSLSGGSAGTQKDTGICKP